MVATATPDGLKILSYDPHLKRLHIVDHMPDLLPPLSTLFVARTSEDSLSTTIVALTSDFTVMTWTYSSALKKIEEGGTQSLNEGRSPAAPIAVAVGVPVSSSSAAEGDVETARMLVVDTAGTISFWSASIPDSVYTWREEEGCEVKTGRKGVVMAACNEGLMSALGESR